MRKENIFLLTLRTASTPTIKGGLEQIAVCSVSVETVTEYAKNAFPHKQVLGVTSMAELESTLKGIKEALECKPGAHPVFIDPRLKSAKVPTQH